jgi:hypothetical protein
MAGDMGIEEGLFLRSIVGEGKAVGGFSRGGESGMMGMEGESL